MKYEPNLNSVRKHKVPEWFHDAKLGIFIHWSLSSIPAFASTKRGNILEIIEKEGWKGQFTYNPYAEWYLNTMKIKESPTYEYHLKNYGENSTYDDFAPIFNEKAKKWNPNEMTDFFQKIGAKYVVLVTKHHDGFLLWPSKNPNPIKKNWQSERNIVGELTRAVKARNMKMGFYYSGGIDWSFTPKIVILDAIDMLTSGPLSREYIEYVNNHYHELIDDYEPSILWNDICYPPGFNLNELFAYFYNKNPDGVVNDRWTQISKTARAILKFPILKSLISWIGKRMMLSGSTGPKPPHCDYITPEYTSLKKFSKDKWECTRGIGKSFGFNQFETSEDYLSVKDLVHLLVDIVSKNGNLLLNVGPMADGTIPEIQKERLLGLGKWLSINGDAIYNTRPWIKAEGITSDNIPIRYTQKNETLYIILLEKPIKNQIIINSLKISDNSSISLLGYDNALNWKQEDNNLKISFPNDIEDSPAYTYRITPKPN